jgi:hypothetical protein
MINRSHLIRHKTTHRKTQKISSEGQRIVPAAHGVYHRKFMDESHL